MDVNAKRNLLLNRKKCLESNGKDNANIVRKIKRELKKLDNAVE